MTIITDSSELSINLFQCLYNKKPTFFKTKSPSITFGVFKSREFLGVGSISLCNNPQWVSIHPPKNSHQHHKKSSFVSTSNQFLAENLRIKLYFSKESRNNLMRTPSTFQNENNNSSNNTIMASLHNNNSMSIDLKHKKTKSFASPLITSPLSPSKQHKLSIHPTSNTHKLLGANSHNNNNNNNTTSPNKQPKTKKHIMRTCKDKKAFSTINNYGRGNCNNTLCYSNSYQNNILKQSSSTHIHKMNISSAKKSPKPNVKKINYAQKNNNDIPIQASFTMKTLSDYHLDSSKVLPKTLLTNLDKQEIENHIIDQSYEDNIKNDEIIDDENTNKSFIKYFNDNNNNLQENESNISNTNVDTTFNIFEKEDLELNDLSKKYLDLNSDFNLLYSKDYVNGVDDTVLNLEIELFIEKILELQNAYYTLLKAYNSVNKKIKNYSLQTKAKIKKLLQKQLQLKLEMVDVLNKPFGYTNMITELKNVNFPQKQDINLWKQIFLKRKNNYDNINSNNTIVKTLIITIMKNVLTNKYTNNKLTNLEKATLKRIVNENEMNTPKHTGRNGNEQIKNGNVDYGNENNNINVNNPLIDERLNTLKKKLLPLINENSKDNCVTINDKGKYKVKTQSKSISAKSKFRGYTNNKK